MTVQELIDCLKEFDPNLEVTVNDECNGIFHNESFEPYVFNDRVDNTKQVIIPVNPF
jgi:hypothetical protein